MRSKRITILALSALMALTTVGLTAPAASADYDKHPNIVIQAAIRMDNIEATSNNYRKANQAVQLGRDLRHWIREHSTPRFVSRVGCSTEFRSWMFVTNQYARQAFRSYRTLATGAQEWPSGWERQAAKVRARILLDRAEGRQEDAQKDFLNCVFDSLPNRARGLFY